MLCSMVNMTKGCLHFVETWHHRKQGIMKMESAVCSRIVGESSPVWFFHSKTIKEETVCSLKSNSHNLNQGRGIRCVCSTLFFFVSIRQELFLNWSSHHAAVHKIKLDLYSLPNIVRVVKLRRMRWAGHVARMGEDRGVHRVLMGKPEGKRPLGRPRRRWEDILRWIFRKLEGVVGTGWSWLTIRMGGGHLWVRWGTFGLHKCGEFLD